MKGVLSWLVLPAMLAAQNGAGRYIIELDEVPVAETVLRTPKQRRSAALYEDLRAAAAPLRERQRTMAARIEARGARVLDSVQIVANALLVRASEEIARELATMPGVKRVIPSQSHPLHMDRALVRHAVPAAWTRIGGMDRAGFGIRIGIIDTGVDASHPAFHDPGLAVPEGFPRANAARELGWTNNKVIVARSYDTLYGAPAPTESDVRGHGTAVAACAAAASTQGAYGEFAGLAPKAHVGSYRVFPGAGTQSEDDVILKALDDAVADGMNVINMSLGSPLALRAGDSVFGEVFRRLAALGVLVVVSAGNDGPGAHTVGDNASQSDALAVGAVHNDRAFAGSVTIEGLSPVLAVPSGKHQQAPDVSGAVFDIEGLDPTGLGCSAYPADALKGFIALIRRGTCTFEVKVNHAAQAGAVAVLVYSQEASPEPVAMSLGTATLPSAMVSYSDGLRIKEKLRAAPGATATIRFRATPWPSEARRITDFSSRGPNVDYGIKPDLVAVGQSVYTAEPRGGYTIIQGTSFSAPIVTGAAAVLMARRPGLAVWQYRSLLINSADTLLGPDGAPAPVQHQGAGVLNLDRALQNTLTAYPTAVSFGVGPGSFSAARTIWLATIGDAPEDITAAVEPFTPESTVTVGSVLPRPAPLALLLPRYATLPPGEVRVNPGALQPLQIRFSGSGLRPGHYQGFIKLRSASGQTIQLPYWYGVASNSPHELTLLRQTSSSRAGSTLTLAIQFRITDAAGARLTGTTPTVSVVSGGGSVLRVYSRDAVFPGVFAADVRLGPAAGTNVFRVQVGDLTRDVTITGN